MPQDSGHSRSRHSHQLARSPSSRCCSPRRQRPRTFSPPTTKLGVPKNRIGPCASFSGQHGRRQIGTTELAAVLKFPPNMIELTSYLHLISMPIDSKVGRILIGQETECSELTSLEQGPE